MKKFPKRTLALAMTLAMLLSLSTIAFAAEYADMPAEGHWSREAVQAAVDNGLFNGGSDGLLRPGDNISRAELAKVVVSAFGADAEADISAYTDVPANAWYYGSVAKAKQMGIMQGSNGAMRPTSSITRQEAFTILARALKLEDGTAADLTDYPDAGGVADWFVGPVAAMVKAGYVSGSNGRLNPTGKITRAEFAQVMHNIFATYITEAGVFTEVGNGNVIVNAPDVTLKDCTVPGDLVIADGVDDGDVTLDNVKVDGRLVVRGGGVNSIHILNNSKVSSDIVVTKVDGNVRVYADVTSEISVITVDDGKEDVIIEGTVGIVTVANSETPVVIRNATVVSIAVTAPNASVTLEDSKVNSVAVSAADAKVSLTGTTTVATVQVDSAAEGATVSAEAGTKIETVKADTDVTVDGDGQVNRTEGEGKVADSQGEEIKTTPAPAPSNPEPSNPTPSNPEPSNPGPSNPEPSVPAVHTHVWATEWSKDEGTHWHACTVSGCTARADEGFHTWRGNEDCVCGMPLEEDHEHIFDEENWQPLTDSDLASTTHFCVCTVEGCNHRLLDQHTMGSPDANGNSSCTKCGYTTKGECASGHKVTTWSLDGNNHKGTCSVCNETVMEEHIWGEETDGKVTCTAPGCGATKSVSCEHAWNEINNTATCTEAGTLTRLCSKCDLEQQVAAPAKGHTWDNPTDGTGEFEGKKVHTCPVCGTTEEVTEGT